jgi:hypothetical protein
MSEVWTSWEGEVIGGAFPLRRFLGGSDHSGVFLTACTAQNTANAAIKIVAADPALDEAQLSRWRTAATLSHPHLIRLLDMGRCQLADRPFLFVVMEYAEQTLSQILPRRALTADEVQEMLPPTLDALAFLHRKILVHGQLKPSNFLVVSDQLKLSSDGIRPAGQSTSGSAQSSAYDPPEEKNGSISTAGDIWALGVTMVEALTQRPAAGPDESNQGRALAHECSGSLRGDATTLLESQPRRSSHGQRPRSRDYRAAAGACGAACPTGRPPSTRAGHSVTQAAQAACVGCDYRNSALSIGHNLGWLAAVAGQTQAAASRCRYCRHILAANHCGCGPFDTTGPTAFARGSCGAGPARTSRSGHFLLGAAPRDSRSCTQRQRHDSGSF